jgi:hypothetical protein
VNEKARPIRCGGEIDGLRTERVYPVNIIPSLNGKKEVAAEIANHLKRRRAGLNPPLKDPAAQPENQQNPSGSSGSSGFPRVRGVVGELACFFSDYLVFRSSSDYLVIAAWTVAAFFARIRKVWRMFPHLAINSPAWRSGKSTSLKAIDKVSLNSLIMTNPTVASVRRMIEGGIDGEPVTLLFDEASNLAGTDPGARVFLEMLNSGIELGAMTALCEPMGKGGYRPAIFRTFCPKAFAKNGPFDPVLLDRCLPIEMIRRSKEQRNAMKDLDSEEADNRANAMKQRIVKWCEGREHLVTICYRQTKPFDLNNERLAKLLFPLQTVIRASSGRRVGPARIEDTADTQQLLTILEDYAKKLDGQEDESPEMQVLAACRELFKNKEFIWSDDLVTAIDNVTDLELSKKKLSILLRPFNIKPKQICKHEVNKRGYEKHAFEKAWKAYLPPVPSENR